MVAQTRKCLECFIDSLVESNKDLLAAASTSWYLSTPRSTKKQSFTVSYPQSCCKPVLLQRTVPLTGALLRLCFQGSSAPVAAPASPVTQLQADRLHLYMETPSWAGQTHEKLPFQSLFLLCLELPTLKTDPTPRGFPSDSHSFAFMTEIQLEL